jgi:hypothetical protein
MWAEIIKIFPSKMIKKGFLSGYQKIDMRMGDQRGLREGAIP